MRIRALTTVKLMKMGNVLFVNGRYVFAKNGKKKSSGKSKTNEEDCKMILTNLKRKEIKSLEHF